MKLIKYIMNNKKGVLLKRTRPISNGMIKNFKIKYLLFIVLFFTLFSIVFVQKVSAQVTNCGDEICEDGEDQPGIFGYCPLDCDTNNNNNNNNQTSAGTPASTFCKIETDPGAQGPRIGNLLNFVTCIIGKSVVPLIFALAALMFFWGVVQYVIGGAEEKEKAKGKQFMIWGIVAIAVMISVWGLVRVLTNTFDIDFSAPQVRDK